MTLPSPDTVGEHVKEYICPLALVPVVVIYIVRRVDTSNIQTKQQQCKPQFNRTNVSG